MVTVKIVATSHQKPFPANRAAGSGYGAVRAFDLDTHVATVGSPGSHSSHQLQSRPHTQTNKGFFGARGFRSSVKTATSWHTTILG